jgi:4-phosphopantoate--beta-alanine ligase
LFIADLAFVPLEDGDRTEGLVKVGKKVVTVDLNPLSRTAQMANITIVDNVVRALPLLISDIKTLKDDNPETWTKIVANFDNRKNLSEAILLIIERLQSLAKIKELTVI